MDSPFPPSGKLRARLPWALVALAAIALSWSIPLFSSQDPRSGTLAYPPLYPVYFQSNEDAPLEIQTCLGFPGYYREEPYRVSRPTFYAVLAGLREAALDPIARLVSGGAGSARWGISTARETILTYFLWLLANAACLLGAARMGYALIAARLPAPHASLAALFLLTTPVLLLVMREIHLNCYQVFTALACLAFFEALLRDRLGGWRLIGASLLLGLLFLGKPNLNLFGAGAALCLLRGRWRELLIAVPLTALPILLWMGAARALGYEWSVPEVTRWKAGVWIIEAGPRLAAQEFILYVRDWSRALGESLTPAHLLLAAGGAVGLWRGTVPSPAPGRTLLGVGAVVAAADFAFYFLVHRVHAAYYVGTLLGLYALAAAGLLRTVEAAGARLLPALGASARIRIAFAAALLLQAALLIRQLPRYPG